MPITDQSMYIYLGSTVRVDCDAEKYIKQRKSKARYIECLEIWSVYNTMSYQTQSVQEMCYDPFSVVWLGVLANDKGTPAKTSIFHTKSSLFVCFSSHSRIFHSLETSPLSVKV